MNKIASKFVARPRHENYHTNFYESIAVPASLLKKFDNEITSKAGTFSLEDYIGSSFGKFRVDVPNSAHLDNPRSSLILHLMKKVILRGHVTCLSPELERTIARLTGAETFDAEDNMDDNPLTIIKKFRDIYESNYSSIIPDELHDGTPRTELGGLCPEAYFYRQILCPFLLSRSPKFLYDVIPEVLFSSLVDGDVKDDRRVDFLLTHGQPIVIEIDDLSHESHQGSDAERDALLLNQGIRTFRIPDSELTAPGPATQRLFDYLEETYKVRPSYLPRPYQNYFVAVKLAHIFQICLLEAATNHDLSGQSIHFAKDCYVDFEHADEVLAAALADLKYLDSLFAKLYDESPILEGTKYVKQAKSADIIISENPTIGSTKLQLNILFRPINFRGSTINFDHPYPLIPTVDSPDKKVLEGLLEYIFGFPAFRDKQIDGIIRALRGQDSIVLLPTGSGKSIVYQFLSYIRPGCTIVIEPLRSLMADQVENLHWRGFSTAALVSSDLSREEVNHVEEALISGAYAIVYVTPERMCMKEFHNILHQAIDHGLAFPLVALDEAHCISEWGHDFRVSYLSIAERSRRLFLHNGIPPVVLALTGTASDTVLRDMRNDLNILADDALVRPHDFDRPELHFRVISADLKSKPAALEKLLTSTIPEQCAERGFENLLMSNGESSTAGIIFCQYKSSNTPFGVDSVYNYLTLHFPESKDSIVKFYTAGDNSRGTMAKNAHDFKTNAKNLMIATKAFGMGIDKPNIRYIIHYGFSSSIEAYYQEAGRAGRDGRDATSYIILSNADPVRNADYVNHDVMELGGIKGVRDDMSNQIFLLSGNYDLDTSAAASNRTIDQLGTLKAKRINLTLPRALKPSDPDYTKVIYQLRLLHIIDEYFIIKYQSTSYEFELDIPDFDRARIIDSFIQYVSRYRPGEEEYERAKFNKATSLSPSEFAKFAARTLLDFSARVIGKNRLVATDNMLRLADRAAQISTPTGQDAFIREEIQKYLSSDNEKLLYKILDANTNLDVMVDIISRLSQKEYGSVLAEARRLRESHSSHPGLGIFTNMLEILTLSSDPGSVAANLEHVVDEAILMYSLPRPYIEGTLLCIIKTTYQKCPSSDTYITFLVSFATSASQKFREEIIDVLPPSFHQPIIEQLYLTQVQNIISKLKKENYYGQR